MFQSKERSPGRLVSPSSSPWQLQLVQQLQDGDRFGLGRRCRLVPRLEASRQNLPRLRRSQGRKSQGLQGNQTFSKGSMPKLNALSFKARFLLSLVLTSNRIVSDPFTYVPNSRAHTQKVSPFQFRPITSVY